MQVSCFFFSADLVFRKVIRFHYEIGLIVDGEFVPAYQSLDALDVVNGMIWYYVKN